MNITEHAKNFEQLGKKKKTPFMVRLDKKIVDAANVKRNKNKVSWSSLISASLLCYMSEK